MFHIKYHNSNLELLQVMISVFHTYIWNFKVCLGFMTSFKRILSRQLLEEDRREGKQLSRKMYFQTFN